MSRTDKKSQGIVSWPEGERPRERLLNRGPQALTDAELIAILVRVGYKGTSAVELGRQVLKKFGSLRALVEAPVVALLDVKGLKGAKAAQLMAAMEIARRVSVPAESRKLRIKSTAAAAEYLMERLRGLTVLSLHEALGSRVGSRLFIIAPSLTFDFQQDYIDCGNVRYYALRIPYSIIHELHQREFTALKQPSDELAVNDTVEAVGFDFIRRPEIEYEAGVDKKKGELLDEAFIRVKTFKSEAAVREPVRQRENRETLSMVMLDYDFDTESDVFNLDGVFYAEKMEKEGWELRFPVEDIGSNVMAVFVDFYGNEARELIPAEQFTGTRPRKRRKGKVGHRKKTVRKATANGKKKSSKKTKTSKRKNGNRKAKTTSKKKEAKR